MTREQKIATGAVALAVLGGIAAALLVQAHRRKLAQQPKPIPLVGAVMGAVVRQNTDPRGESPIADVEISAAGGLSAGVTRTNFSGLFTLALRPGVAQGQAITLLFKHPGYQPLAMSTVAGDQLYVARMVPLHPEPRAALVRPSVAVSDVRVRYTVQRTTAETVGTEATTFQVVNTANIPCDPHAHSPCSPDGRWKAAVGSASLDAGKGNVLGDPRVSCIAGPCPFTQTRFEDPSQDGRVVKVTALSWSDTTTFLLQAEVVHPEVGVVVQQSYPVIFGRELNFSLPATAEGPSLEATLNGVQIIFPLPSNPDLSWTACKVSLETGQTKLYRCELKPSYQFR